MHEFFRCVMLSFSTILKYILKSYSIGIICLFSSISSTKVCLGLWSPMTPCCAVTIKIHVYCYRTRGLPYLYQVLNLYIILEARQYRLMHYCLHSSESSNVTSSIICYDCNIYLDTPYALLPPFFFLLSAFDRSYY
jgi:hypothetical protein